MRILIIAYLFPPTNSMGALRPASWARHWSKSGHHVSVVSAADLTQLTNHDAYSSINFIPIKHNDWFSQAKYYIKKLLKRNSFPAPSLSDLWWWQTYLALIKLDFDVVVSSYNPYINHWLGYLLKRRNPKLIWIADYRDLWSQNHFLQPNYWHKKFNSYLERKFNLTADLLTTVSEPLATILAQQYPQQKIYTLTNGFDRSSLDNLPHDNYWQDNKIHLVYTGTIYPEYQDLTPLFEALNLLKHQFNLVEHLVIDLVGSIPQSLNNKIKYLNLADVVFCHQPTSRSQCLQMQRDAHGVIFIEYDYMDNQAILTGKIFEYLICGSPIIGIGSNDSTGAGKIINLANVGINFANDVSKLTNYLSQLIQLQQKISLQANLQFLEQFDQEYLSNLLLEQITQLRAKYAKS
ncbi:MAG: hypothetical protein RLZZ293_854 [Pseudomonadota bacterium]|jgi:glycosyltransferase involved in cell wall biosynthesis